MSKITFSQTGPASFRPVSTASSVALFPLVVLFLLLIGLFMLALRAVNAVTGNADESANNLLNKKPSNEPTP